MTKLETAFRIWEHCCTKSHQMTNHTCTMHHLNSTQLQIKREKLSSMSSSIIPVWPRQPVWLGQWGIAQTSPNFLVCFVFKNNMKSYVVQDVLIFVIGATGWVVGLCYEKKAINICRYLIYAAIAALAEWLRRVPAKYMGFPRESSNLSGCECQLYNAAGSFFKNSPRF